MGIRIGDEREISRTVYSNLNPFKTLFLSFYIIYYPYFNFEDKIFYLVVDDVIPAISACIINTIFLIMMWLDLGSLGQNNHQTIGPFYQSISLFIDQSIAQCPSHCHFSGKLFLVTGLLNRLPLYTKRLPLCLGRHHQVIA